MSGEWLQGSLAHKTLQGLGGRGRRRAHPQGPKAVSVSSASCGVWDVGSISARLGKTLVMVGVEDHARPRVVGGGGAQALSASPVLPVRRGVHGCLAQ